MTYRQLTPGERSIISCMRAQGHSHAEIARYLGRHRSTISREVARNSSPDGFYRARMANYMASGRRSRSRRNTHFSMRDLGLVECFIRLDWSPDQIAQRLRDEGMLSISHERVYRHVWLDRSLGGDLWTHLRQSPKQRRKRRSSYDSRGRLAGKRHISERPEVVERRERIGDFEIDTVMGRGSKHCVVTLVERVTGYVMIGKLRNRTKEELTKRTIKMIRRCPVKVRTITSDNGTEFHDYKRVEKVTGVRFYFATPYHSWERGTSENTNGLIRTYLPKRKSMSLVSQWDCNAIARQLNTRPRKRLGYWTPEECIYGR